MLGWSKTQAKARRVPWDHRGEAPVVIQARSKLPYAHVIFV